MPTLPQTPRPSPMAKYRACRSAFEFAVDLEKAAQVLGIESARETAVTLALVLDDKITAGTPVDTGRARANWFVSEGAPRLETTESTTPAQRPKLEGRTVIYITNSLPYIVPLEYGHSGQAPHGMVRKAIAEVMASINVGTAA
jgi:hypothetical protein